MPRKMSLYRGMTSLWRKDAQGQTAPNHRKIDRFRSMSMVGCNESSSVSNRNQSL